MFCTKCGSHNLDDAEICRACSAPLVKRESRTAPLPTPPPTSAPPSPGPAPTMRYADPPRTAGHASPPSYNMPSSNQPTPPGYQPYQSSYADYTPPLPQSASGRAIASMVLSLVSLVTCGPFLSIPGMILGKMEMNAIRDGQAPRAGETFAKIGFYVGLVMTGIFCLGALIVLFFGLLGALTHWFD